MVARASCRRVVAKACWCVGVTLLYMPNDLNWYWGNLVVYVDSYINASHGATHITQAPWLTAGFLSAWGVSLMIGAWLHRTFSTFQVAAMGVVVYNVGLFSSYFSVQESTYLLAFTMGVVCGLGYGLIQSMVYLWVKDMTNRNLALAYGMLSNCLNLGGMLVNQVTTFYINPRNLEAKLDVGLSKLFTEKSVVDKVPSFFLVLASMISIFHLVGLSTVRLAHGFINRDKYLTIESSVNQSFCSKDTQKKEEKVKQYQTGPSENLEEGPSDSHDKDTQEEGSLLYTEKSLTLREALRTKAFFFLCFALMACDLCYICVLNFYKKFGGGWIDDDHFLMEIGISSSLAAMVNRLIWGVFMDRYGVKCSSILFLSCISVASSTYYLTPRISKWLFSFWTMTLCSLCTSQYIVFPVASVRLFGHANMADIYGAVMSTTILTNLVGPVLLDVVLRSLGWLGLYTGIGVINLVVLVGVIWGIPSR